MRPQPDPDSASILVWNGKGSNEEFVEAPP